MTRCGLLITLLSLPHAAFAAPAVPDALKPWVPWALEGQDQLSCPFVYTDAQTRRCAFASRLSLSVSKSGGDFTYDVEAYRPQMVVLPGDASHWPLDVKVDTQPAVIVQKGGEGPSIALTPGRHTLSGHFAWDSMPEALQLPRPLALLELRLNGGAVPGATPEKDGRLFLRKSDGDGEEASNVEVRVHRLLTDDIPLRIRTHIAIDVSGKNREIVLGPVLGEGLTPMRLDSPLPARLSDDGMLHVQAGPGQWNLYVDARHVGPTNDLAPPKAPKPWPEQEVWAVELRPELRQATVEGVPSIDASQTALPDDWRKFPAYRLTPGDKLTLKETSRGNDESVADQLTLKRTWWLDFDGKGYTLQDLVTGDVKRSWRLEMAAPTALGRIAVDGRDQFITKLGDRAPAGVELRRGKLSLIADSRYEDGRVSLPAVGWDQDFQHVGGALQLPPGWRLFAATGVDKATGTWVEAWALMDFFLLLLVSIATFRLAGPVWGLLAFVTLVITITETDAPRYLWLAGILALALVRVVKPGRATKFVALYRIGVALVFAFIALPFMEQQIHVAIHACLEHPEQDIYVDKHEEPVMALDDVSVQAPTAAQVANSAPAPEEQMKNAPADEVQAEGGAGSDAAAPRGMIMKKAPVSKAGNAYVSNSISMRQVLNDYDPKAKVQTGPGLPAWRWRTSALIWNGPVDRHQELHFWLMPPWLNSFLGLLRCVLLVALIAIVMGMPTGRGKLTELMARLKSPDLALRVFLPVALAFGVAPGKARAGDLPDKGLLDELRSRLLKAPECLPACAASPRMAVEFDAQTLRLRLEIHAADDVMVPLPGRARDWSADPVTVDGKPATALYRDEDGVLWAHLGKGVHQLVLAGPLPRREAVQLTLPLKPHHVTAAGSGWTISGIHEDGLADDNLELKRVHAAGEKGSAQVQPTTLPPFVQVERELVIDLTWQVHTRVVRQTPSDAAVVVKIPLLAGEAVTSAGVHTEGGAVLVNMAPGATEAEWSSVLEPHDALTLIAPAEPSWMETWRLDVSPIWHFAWEGVPVLPYPPGEAQRAPTWRPWPKEALTIKLSRPGGVEGQSLTIDGTTLRVKPGVRATDVVLAMNLRSSRGGQHTLTLPPGADLQAFTVDGKDQSLRRDGQKLNVPLVPGAEQVNITWRQDGGVTTALHTPVVDLGQPSVNGNVQLEMPEDRWTLWTNGPRMGPAVLYWGTLVFLLIVATALGNVPLTPLRFRHWLLLGLGLSQTSVLHAVVIATLFLCLGARGRLPPPKRSWLFNLMQVGLVFLALGAAAALIDVIQAGFLGHPDMQIRGNASSNLLLRWYQDRVNGAMPVTFALSVPMLFYRLAMLAWALWLALFLLKTARWIWESFGHGGLWQKPPPRPRQPVVPPFEPPPPAKGPP